MRLEGGAGARVLKGKGEISETIEKRKVRDLKRKDQKKKKRTLEKRKRNRRERDERERLAVALTLGCFLFCCRKKTNGKGVAGLGT